MRVRIATILFSLFFGPLGLVGLYGSPAHAVADVDCSDFNTQAAAQAWFNNHDPKADPSGLDAEGDGIACESLPCPCSHAGPSGGGDNGSNGSTGSTGGTKHPPVVKQRAQVIRVVDGDTVDVRLGTGKKARVRLIGIDTPEVYGGTECGGPEASKAAKRLLPRGTRVRLISDPTQQLRDRYGRLLRYVMKGTRDINRAQLNFGHATVYVYAHKPFQRVKSYRAARSWAERHHKGIWKDCK